MLRVAVAALGSIVVVWLVFLGVLLVLRPDTATAKEAVRLVPDTARMIKRIATDRTLPLATRLPVWLLLGYLVAPVDLVPDFLPIVGYADDVILAAVVLRHVVRKAGPAKLTQHWTGTPEALDRLRRLLRLAS